MVRDSANDGRAPLGFAEQWFDELGSLSSEDVRHARRWLIVTGVLAILGGMAAWAVPVVASVTMSIFLGWLLVAAGIVMGSHALARRTPLRVTLRLIEALVTVLVGIYVIVFPLSGTITLTFALAVWFFATGVTQIAAALREAGAVDRGITALSGAASVVLGVLIAVSWPSSSAWAIGLLVGINLVFWGVRALGTASVLGRLPAAGLSSEASAFGRRRQAAAGTPGPAASS